MTHVIVPPSKLHNSREQKQLGISWPSGEQHTISHQQLRAACRCATCRGKQIHGQIALINAGVTIVKIQPMPQGLQFIFSDGHERGIFPWRYLFELGETYSTPLPEPLTKT